MNEGIYRLEIYTIVFAMNWGINSRVGYSFYSPALPQKRFKSIKKKKTSNMNNSFDVT